MAKERYMYSKYLPFCLLKITSEFKLFLFIRLSENIILEMIFAVVLKYVRNVKEDLRI